MTFFMIYLLIGVIIVLINYEKMQETCLKYLNDEIDSKPYLYASVSNEVLNILEKYLFLFYIILWPSYFNTKIEWHKKDKEDTNK